MLQQEKILNTLNKLLNQQPKIRKGTDAVYFCPKCHHAKRKLEISLTTGKYHCWVCGLSGMNLGTLLRKLNAPTEYYEILGEFKRIKQRDAFDEMFNKKEETIIINSLPEEFKPLYNCDNSDVICKHANHYLKSRGITDIDIYRYNIGYCDSGEYRNRIIIPSYDNNGELNFFSARDFYNTSWLKYVLCKFSKNIIGFEMMIDFTQPVTLVEGSFDAIAVRTNCIPLFGKTLSQKLKIKLLENKPPYVTILLDNDALKDSIKISEFLIKNDINVKLVKLEEKDPSVLGFNKTWEYINNTKFLTFDELFSLRINL